jgi:hypothetical protein
MAFVPSDQPPAPPAPFTPETVLAATQELIRSLKQWHHGADDDAIIVTETEGENWSRQTFREVAFEKPHGRGPRDRRNDPPGTFILCKSDEVDGRAVWLVRDYWERLRPRRLDPRWAHLRQAFDRLLGVPLYSYREVATESEWEECMNQYNWDKHLDGFALQRGYIRQGRRVDPPVLADLEDAAREIHGQALQDSQGGEGKSADRPLPEQVTLSGRVMGFFIDRTKKLGRVPTLDEVRQAFPGEIGPDSTFYRNNPWYKEIRFAARRMLSQHEPPPGHQNAAEDGGGVDGVWKTPDYHGDEE